jgi:hypothetical protein
MLLRPQPVADLQNLPGHLLGKDVTALRCQSYFTNKIIEGSDSIAYHSGSSSVHSPIFGT